MKKHYLLASDFDQTLSFNDSGIILSELLGIAGLSREGGGARAAEPGAAGRRAGLSAAARSRVPPGRGRPTCVEVGRRVRLKRNVRLLTTMLAQGIDGHRFDFCVISAAPEEVVLAALDGIVPPDHIVGTRFEWDAAVGRDRIGGPRGRRLRQGGGGRGAALQLALPRDQVVYVGDGQSDIPVMLHVNRGDGFTIAASEAREVAQHRQAHRDLRTTPSACSCRSSRRSWRGVRARSGRCSSVMGS